MLSAAQADDDQIELDEHVYRSNSTEKDDQQSINRLIHQPEAEQQPKVTVKKKDLIVHFEELSKFRLFLNRMSKVKCVYFGFIVVLVASILVTFFVTKHAHGPGVDKCPPKHKDFLLDAPRNTTPVYRLPGNVTPLNYDIKLKVFLQPQDELFYFTGLVSILAQCNTPTKIIQLNANELKIDFSLISVENEQGDSIKVASVDLTNEVLNIELERNLEAKKNYTIHIPAFKGNLTTSLSGFYRSSYNDPETGETRYFAMSQFQATDARRAFPCWDEPAFKATFNIELTHSSHMTAIANMPASTTVVLL